MGRQAKLAASRREPLHMESLNHLLTKDIQQISYALSEFEKHLWSIEPYLVRPSEADEDEDEELTPREAFDLMLPRLKDRSREFITRMHQLREITLASLPEGEAE